MLTSWMASSQHHALSRRGVVIIMAMASAFIALPARGTSDTLVISAIYSGGNTIGSAFNRDYIELFNRGTTAISIDGWSLQWQSGGTTEWLNVLNLTDAVIEPGRYFLVGVGNAGSSPAAGAPLPAVDAEISILTSGLPLGTAKLALVNTSTQVPGATCDHSSIIDLVQYGPSTEPCAEGAPAGQPSITTAALRKQSGCQDTDSNGDDFEIIAPPTPRNSSSPAHACVVGPTPCPADIAANGAVDINDLLSIILGWGPCPQPCPSIENSCPADIAPVSGNCAVDVDDLLTVISGWGPCT